MNFNWPFTSAKRRARCARRNRAKGRMLDLLGPRTLRLEAVEPRLLLSHTAPMLNANDTPGFYALPENVPIASNAGQSLSTMLATGGAITK